MPRLALFAMVLNLVLLSAGRIGLQYRRTGDSGLRRPSPEDRSVAIFTGMLSFVGGTMLAVTPVLVLYEALPMIGPLQRTWIHAVGVLSAFAGSWISLAAQLQMGDSWRVGVDRTERTQLITCGLFRSVRNPIYSGLALFAIGIILLVPGLFPAIGFVLAAIGIAIQVRKVEEPHLLAMHPSAYRSYASSVGRFVPGLGRVPLPDPQHVEERSS